LGRRRDADGGVKETGDARAIGNRANGDRDGDEDALSGPGLRAGTGGGSTRTGRAY